MSDQSESWRAYVDTRTPEQLFLDASKSDDPTEDYQLLMLHAIATRDQAIRKMAEAREIKHLRDNDASFPILFQVMRYFGDAPAVVSWSLDHGARIDARGINDWTPLHLACLHGYIGLVQALVERGADINARTRIDDRFTPLEEAIVAGHKNVVEFLLSEDADVTGALYLSSRERHEFVPILERHIKTRSGLSRRKQKRQHGRRRDY